MNTILLNPSTWDLMIDAQNHIAVASNPYSLAQNAAQAIRLFAGEYWYDITIGVPYNASILGKAPSLPFIKAQFVKAALTVPEVAKARCFITGVGVDRQVKGQVQVETAAGVAAVTGF